MKTKKMANADIIKALEDAGLTQVQIAATITARGVSTTQATISRIKQGSKTNSDLERALVELAMEHGIIAESAGSVVQSKDLIDEVDVFTGLGGGGLSIIENTVENGIIIATETVRDHWRIPAYMLNRFNAQPRHIKAFPAQGDSMAPTIEDGDVVFADTRHRVPSPPGIYVLADEFGGVVTKRLEVVSRPSDEIVTVRISSDNPNHKDRELTLDEINIIGRYVGRFTV